MRIEENNDKNRDATTQPLEDATIYWDLGNKEDNIEKEMTRFSTLPRTYLFIMRSTKEIIIIINSSMTISCTIIMTCSFAVHHY